jgi:riboflavin synthase
MAETLRMSTLGDAKATDAVNLERAMAANGRFGGHMVQGHVDGVGTVDQIEKEGGNCILWIAAVEAIMKQMIQKGSVAIDGISLTIVKVEKKRFSVSLIPTTLQETNLHLRKRGDTVNLEIDLVSKWINKRLDQILAEEKKGGSVTWEKLRDAGF